MSHAATSIFVYSFYLIIQGLLLRAIPNVELGLFGLQSTQEVWVRVLGYSLLVLASYFLVAAYREVTDLILISIVFRLALPVVFGGIVVLSYAKPALLLLTPTDVLFALWTAWGLWRSQRAPAAAKA